MATSLKFIWGSAALLLIALAPGCGADDSGGDGQRTGDTRSALDTATIADSLTPVDTLVVPDTVEIADAGVGDTDRAVDTVDSDGADALEGGFGSPCQGNNDCLDGFCVEGEEGFFCTRTCVASCPDKMDCKSVLTGGADPVFLCLPRLEKVCVPCATDFQCTGGACLEIGGERQCATSCEAADDCPDVYDCAEDPSGARSGKFCQPRSGSCDCTPELAGAVRTCSNESAQTVCYGVEHCDPETGWGGCDATTPGAEICDGVDNDCNGLVDDGVSAPAATCERSGNGGVCVGSWFCGPDPSDLGTIDWICNAQEPTTEVCDFADNDCDGQTDEGFVDAASGLYISDDHCGSCGNACDAVIPNATSGCAREDGQAFCQVLECDDGFYQAGPLSCLKVVNSLCSPCDTDANCPTPGDSCLDYGSEGRFCGRDCGAGSLHEGDEGECPTGFECITSQLNGDSSGGSGGGAEVEIRQCRPLSGVCSCLMGDAGDTRTCLRANAAGTCYGQEICDPQQGWVGCSVTYPEAEVCDGVDNDCNQAADDVAGRGAACTIDNEFGHCGGVLECQVGGGEALVCLGQVPAAETCNYADDDCDGSTDETFGDLFTACSAGRGLCQRFGVVQCEADGSGTACNAVAGAQQDEVCDDFDNDCDGATDEGAAWAAKGTTCTAGVGVCASVGIWDCDASGAGLRCGAQPNDTQDEICDLLDNDCDGVTDNGFIDGQGRYISDGACGNCFTDCTTILDKPGAYGACDGTGAPSCALVCCSASDSHASCDGGDYFDLNAIPDDGCELLLDPDAIYVSVADDAASDGGSCGAGPGATGGGRFPCATINRGIARAQATGRTKVLVAAGAYVESITVAQGVSLFGGYNPVTWERDPATHLTGLFGAGAGSGHRKTLVVRGIKTAATTVDGFTIYGQVAGGTAANSYAVWIRDCNANFTFTHNTIYGGTGGPGGVGGPGDPGAPGGRGLDGVGAREPAGEFGCAEVCVGGNTGGQGGSNAACGASSGGRGGGADCPDYNEGIDQCAAFLNGAGQSQTNTAGGVKGGTTRGGGGGTGGCDNQIDEAEHQSCSCFPASKTGACPLGSFSDAGADGLSGGHGGSGDGCGDPMGAVLGGEWIAATGGPGGGGVAGGGGGGGGAGGGVESYASTCSGAGSDFGGSGGGGGAGGCGGLGGAGGNGGGGAFALFVVFDFNPGSNIPTIKDNTVHTGFGGAGGAGGSGGIGGTGGGAGQGGGGGAVGDDYWCARPGSKGGQGGQGGHGGGGGGGCGGASYGLFVAGQAGASLSSWTNDVLLDGAGGTQGAGGLAGPGGVVGRPGDGGIHGAKNY